MCLAARETIWSLVETMKREPSKTSLRKILQMIWVDCFMCAGIQAKVKQPFWIKSCLTILETWILVLEGSLTTYSSSSTMQWGTQTLTSSHRASARISLNSSTLRCVERLIWSKCYAKRRQDSAQLMQPKKMRSKKSQRTIRARRILEWVSVKMISPTS